MAENTELLKAALIQTERMDIEYENSPSHTAYIILKTAIKSFVGISQHEINEILLKEDVV